MRLHVCVNAQVCVRGSLCTWVYGSAHIRAHRCTCKGAAEAPGNRFLGALELKLDYLKIDRGFVNSIGLETVTSPVLDAVLMLARKLSMTTVAEGVETPEQARWLMEQGVNYLQGFYFARPLTFEQLKEWEEETKTYDELKGAGFSE